MNFQHGQAMYAGMHGIYVRCYFESYHPSKALPRKEGGNFKAKPLYSLYVNKNKIALSNSLVPFEELPLDAQIQLHILKININGKQLRVKAYYNGLAPNQSFQHSKGTTHGDFIKIWVDPRCVKLRPM